mgnify:CR=1 FL=1
MPRLQPPQPARAQQQLRLAAQSAVPSVRRVLDVLEQAGIDFVIPPTVRFAGEPGEQWTLFVRDPSGNALEFKAFADPEQLFRS